MVQLYADKDIQNHFMQSFFSVSTFIQILPITFDKKKVFFTLLVCILNVVIVVKMRLDGYST